MLKPQLKASIIILALFLAVSIAAKAIGSLQPPNPALRGFIEDCEDKPQPCWYGIVPGETKPNEAKQKLQEYGLVLLHETSMRLNYSEPLSSCPVSLIFLQPDEGYLHVKLISFYGCRFLYAGDLMFLPGKIERTPNGITFIDGSAFGTLINWTWVSDPLTPFNDFELRPLHDVVKAIRYEWYGFVPLWRYCQLEPKFPSCVT